MGGMMPGQPNFFAQIMQAYLQGLEMRRQREREDAQMEDRKLQLERLRFEQNRIKLEDKIRAQQMNREGALGNLKMMEGMLPPMEQQDPGFMGPPQQLGPTSMQIPGISAPEAGIDIAGLQAPIRYATDMQSILAEQAERAMALKAQEAAMTAEATARGQANVAREPREDLAALFGFAPPGDFADNLLTERGSNNRQKGQQDFTAEQNRLQRENATRNAGISAGGQVVTVDTVDAQGRPVTRVVPRGQAVGKEFPKAPTGEAASAARAARNGVEALASIEKGFKPEYVGPGTARAYSAQEATGGFIPLVDGIDPDRSEWLATVATTNNRIINELSGANVPPAEFNRIRQGLPMATDPPEVFKAKLRATRAELNRISASTGGLQAGSLQAGQGAPRLGARPRAAGPNGQIIEFNGTAWVPVQ